MDCPTRKAIAGSLPELLIRRMREARDVRGVSREWGEHHLTQLNTSEAQDSCPTAHHQQPDFPKESLSKSFKRRWLWELEMQVLPEGVTKSCLDFLIRSPKSLPSKVSLKQKPWLDLSCKRKPPQDCFPLCWLYNYFTQLQR